VLPRHPSAPRNVRAITITVATATRILRKAYPDAIRMTTLSGPEVPFLSPSSNGFETDAASRLPVYRHLHKIPISQQASVNNVFDGGRHDEGLWGLRCWPAQS